MFRPLHQVQLLKMVQMVQVEAQMVNQFVIKYQQNRFKLPMFRMNRIRMGAKVFVVAVPLSQLKYLWYGYELYQLYQFILCYSYLTFLEPIIFRKIVL